MANELLRGRFLNHPLHPILVHLPIGLWVGSFFFDVIYFLGHEPALAAASYYVMAAGLLLALPTAVAGLWEYRLIPSRTRPKQIATAHLVLNVAVIILYTASYLLRRSVLPTPPAQVTAGAFLVSTLAFVVLSISGYLGGQLVYRYGIGVGTGQLPTSSREPGLKRSA